ncbi:MAG: transposase [Planctomycetes bacterium]|nr:transposase [Planctomycetota bacterium]
MGATRGIHVIWTTYGTWLPGDRRGHWSAVLDLYGRLKRAGHQMNMPDTETHSRARSLMKNAPKELTIAEIQIVANVFGTYLAPGLPGVGSCHAAAIEPTHVHLLFGPVGEPIGTFVGQLKGASSSAVLRRPGNHGRKRIWTAGYWKVFLFEDETVDAVAEYIEAHNTRRGLPAIPFPWITPI